jgi:hypothetical protein
VAVKANLLRQFIGVAPGIEGTRSLFLHCQTGDPKVLSDDLCSFRWPNLSALYLYGERLTKSFYSKKFMNWEKLKTMRSFWIDAIGSHARKALEATGEKLFAEMPLLTELGVSET